MDDRGPVLGSCLQGDPVEHGRAHDPSTEMPYDLNRPTPEPEDWGVSRASLTAPFEEIEGGQRSP